MTGPLLLLAAVAVADLQVETPPERPADFADPPGRRAFALVPVAICLQPDVVGVAGPKPPAPSEGPSGAPSTRTWPRWRVSSG